MKPVCKPKLFGQPFDGLQRFDRVILPSLARRENLGLEIDG
jgi:hypothetical protein